VLTLVYLVMFVLLFVFTLGYLVMSVLLICVYPWVSSDVSVAHMCLPLGIGKTQMSNTNVTRYPRVNTDEQHAITIYPRVNTDEQH
jgi:hypothetical protein